jgi:hypothetical protein
MAYTVTDLKKSGALITFGAITGATGTDAVEINGEAGAIACAQVIAGTAGSVAIQGSLDGTNWFSLKDLQGVVIALTGLTVGADFTTAARYIRALGNGSTSAAVVAVVLRG